MTLQNKWIQKHSDDVCLLLKYNECLFFFLCFLCFFYWKISFIIPYEPSISSFILRFANPFYLSTVDQTEDVVEDEVASLAVGQKLEGLRVVHGLFLLIDLKYGNSNSKLANLGSSAPKSLKQQGNVPEGHR